MLRLTMLRYVEFSCRHRLVVGALKPRPNMSCTFGHPAATCCNMLVVVAEKLSSDQTIATFPRVWPLILCFEKITSAHARVGGAVASRLASSTPDRAVRVRALAGDICVVFLGKTLDFHSASLHPGV